MNCGIVIRTHNGREIAQREEDGYLDAKAMCQANGKLFADYGRLKSTAEYLDELSSVMGIPITELIQTRQGGIPSEQGTYVHRLVAVNLAQWCSAAFAVKVSQWVEELLTRGVVSLDERAESIRDVVRRELREVIAEAQSLPQRQLDLVNPRQYVMECWDGVSRETLRNIIRTMDKDHRAALDCAPPQESRDINAPLMIERSNLWILTRAMSRYMRAERRREQRELFGSVL